MVTSSSHRTHRMAAGLALLAPRAVQAAPPAAAAAPPASTTLQPIVRLGDAVADVKIRSDSKGGYLYMGTLNDAGQIAFVAANADIGNSDMLLQYASGQFLPIVVGGRDAPGGKANKARHRAFIASMKDGTRSAYLLNADGTTTLLLRTGAATPLGKITNIAKPSGYIDLNNQGQVALNVAFDGITTMVLLTPAGQ